MSSQTPPGPGHAKAELVKRTRPWSAASSGPVLAAHRAPCQAQRPQARPAWPAAAAQARPPAAQAQLAHQLAPLPRLHPAAGQRARAGALCSTKDASASACRGGASRTSGGTTAIASCAHGASLHVPRGPWCWHPAVLAGRVLASRTPLAQAQLRRTSCAAALILLAHSLARPAPAGRAAAAGAHLDGGRHAGRALGMPVQGLLPALAALVAVEECQQGLEHRAHARRLVTLGRRPELAHHRIPVPAVLLQHLHVKLRGSACAALGAARLSLPQLLPPQAEAAGAGHGPGALTGQTPRTCRREAAKLA